jgi:hypothetical protein
MICLSVDFEGFFSLFLREGESSNFDVSFSEIVFIVVEKHNKEKEMPKRLLLLLALSLLVLLLCYPAAATAEEDASKDKSYLEMWAKLENDKKVRMVEYMKVRGGHPWRFMRCEACRVSVASFVEEVTRGSSGCDSVESVEALAAPLCGGLLKNQTDLLMENCIKDFSKSCGDLVKAAASLPDAAAMCNATPMCVTKKAPSTKPTRENGETKEDL